MASRTNSALTSRPSGSVSGNRTGSIASAAHSDKMSGTRPGSSSAMTSTAALASNAVTLTSGDLERIKRLTKGEFNLNQKTLEQEADEARAALRKQASLERTKAFPNTLAAMRKRKEAAKDERLRAEEEARVKLDKEEEAIRLQERLRILENAHRQLTENTDKMKMLRSMKLASNIHDVRQRQIALAERKRDMEKEADEEAFQRMLLKIKAGDEREKAEAEARAAQRKAVAVGQKIQLAEFLDRKMREMEEYREEGRKIAAATKQRAIEEEEDKERKKLMVIQQNLEMKEANAAIMRAKVEAQKEAEREAERLAAYVAAKQKDAEVKAGIIRAKQEEAWRKARMIAEKNEREFATRMHGEEERVAAAIAEAEAKADALEEHRRALQRQMRDDIEAHRLAQQKRMDAEAADERRRVAEEKERFEGNMRALDSMENRDKHERRLREKFLKEYQLAQMADKRRVVMDAHDAETSAADSAGSAAAGQNKNVGLVASFAAAAEKFVEEEAAKGHRTLPLRRQIQNSFKDKLISALQIM